MQTLLSTREVAAFLGVNEKIVYTLISEKGLPATKITGKWVFPLHLVEQWVENHTINYPSAGRGISPHHNLLVIAGSNDMLLEKTINLFNSRYPDHIAVFGSLGSMGGIRTLRGNMCHIAASHLLQANETEYNFDFIAKELDAMPAVINFCRREQGILIAPGNPLKINGVGDLGRKGIRIVNRPVGTGTRLLFDMELQKAGIDSRHLSGYEIELNRHMDVGIEILSGRTDAGPGIRAVAGALGLDFIPLRWERFDLLVSRDRFFEQGVQLFLGLLHDKAFAEIFDASYGYDLAYSGKMIYPIETPS